MKINMILKLVLIFPRSIIKCKILLQALILARKIGFRGYNLHFTKPKINE